MIHCEKKQKISFYSWMKSSCQMIWIACRIGGLNARKQQWTKKNASAKKPKENQCAHSVKVPFQLLYRSKQNFWNFFSLFPSPWWAGSKRISFRGLLSSQLGLKAIIRDKIFRKYRARKKKACSTGCVCWVLCGSDCHFTHIFFVR